MKRRDFLAGTAAVAVIPLLPVQAKEVWYYRGVEVVVDRLPGRVRMFFDAPDGREFGLGRLTQWEKTDKAQIRACRRTIDIMIAYQPGRWCGRV